MKVLVTGAAGFIGYHVARRLAETNRCEVLGIDNLNDYYSVELKRARLAQLEPLAKFRFVQADFADATAIAGLVKTFRPDYVVHLGAQAGVRYSMENPAAYLHSNIAGFVHLLEALRAHPPKHTVYASSSSVYGAGATVPFREDQACGQPLSFYAATKRSNELIAHSHAHLHGLALTGVRFFTAYGPWGRPDMTPMIFTKAILAGAPVKLFNEGKNLRDFTYIDDIAEGVVKLLLYPPQSPPVPSARIFNLGHHRPVEMRLFVQMLETLLDRRATLELLPPAPGDMPETCADLTAVQTAIGYAPKVALEEGLRRFVDWYRAYHNA